MSADGVNELYDINPELLLHHGHPVFIEPGRIELAFIPVNGPALHQGILLHPRYIPPGYSHQLISVRGFRRGRSIDILLEEPIEYLDQHYGILNVKGVGAWVRGIRGEIDRPQVIRPLFWYSLHSWDRISECQKEARRIWGGVLNEAARDEFEKDVFFSYRFPSVPHLRKIILRNRSGTPESPKRV